MLWRCIRNLVLVIRNIFIIELLFKLQHLVFISEYEIKIYYKG